MQCYHYYLVGQLSGKGGDEVHCPVYDHQGVNLWPDLGVPAAGLPPHADHQIKHLGSRVTLAIHPGEDIDQSEASITNVDQSEAIIIYLGVVLHGLCPRVAYAAPARRPAEVIIIIIIIIIVIIIIIIITCGPRTRSTGGRRRASAPPAAAQPASQPRCWTPCNRKCWESEED